MKKMLYLLTGLSVAFMPGAYAQEAGKDFIVKFVPDYTIQASDNSYGSARGTVSLALARPDIAPGSHSVYSSSPAGMKRASQSWIIADRQENYSVGSSLVIGDETNPDKRIMISPRLNEVRTSDAGLRSFSAEIRLGNMMSFDRHSAKKGWYIFAAADGEALSINTRSFAIGDDSPVAVSLSDQITVGDLQAGVSTYIGNNTQLTISYIETKAEYAAQGSETISKRESFAGFSIAKSF